MGVHLPRLRVSIHWPNKELLEAHLPAFDEMAIEEGLLSVSPLYQSNKGIVGVFFNMNSSD